MLRKKAQERHEYDDLRDALLMRSMLADIHQKNTKKALLPQYLKIELDKSLEK